MSENYSMNELNPQHDSFLFDIIEILQWSGQLFIVLLKNKCVFLIPRGCSTLFEQMSLFSKFTQAYDNFIQSLIEKGPGTLYKEEDKNMNQVNNKDNRNNGNNARKEESWLIFISMSLLLRWANEKITVLIQQKGKLNNSLSKASIYWLDRVRLAEHFSSSNLIHSLIVNRLTAGRFV